MEFCGIKTFFMTNILIPTDFTPASVKMAEGAIRCGNFEKCNVVLFHAFELPSTPFDLLGACQRDPACELMTEQFRLACKQVKDEYSRQVNKIIVRSMIGNSRALFRNFAEANDIDLIFCPEEYYFRPVHARSVDPIYLFEKSGVPVIRSGARRNETVFQPAFFNTVQVSAQ
jgi:hypothetical protein